MEYFESGGLQSSVIGSSNQRKSLFIKLIQVLMKVIIWLCIMCGIAAMDATAQQSVMKEIDKINPPDIALSPLRYLASDELMGRGTMRPEINIAARYISEQLRSMGVREVKGTTDYFQNFDIKVSVPPSVGGLTIDSTTYKLGDKLLPRSGQDISVNVPLVYAGYGTKEELDRIDVNGKIVVTDLGINNANPQIEALGFTKAKKELVKSKGGVALVERYKAGSVPWEAFQHHFMSEMEGGDVDSSLPVFIINDQSINLPALIKIGKKVSLTSTGNAVKRVPARNVIGWIEGTDAKLKNEYIVLSAHYDHVGIAKQPKTEEGKLDSIYNGARDNAIGTAAIINAARYFSQYPAKRSVLVIAYTGEEMGLIGSRYFADHPAVPLKQLVYNLNIDNASYNDTAIVTIIGLGRTSADNDIKKAASAYGLKAMPDPAPEENFFDRSDNVSLAAKGIPAPTFSLGMKTFDETITNRYHQLSDEVGNFNLSYAMKYMRSYILAVRYIADNDAQPTWIKGDKYESAWKSLFAK